MYCFKTEFCGTLKMYGSGEAGPKLAQAIIDYYSGEFLICHSWKSGPKKEPGFNRPITSQQTIREYRSMVQKAMFLSHDSEDTMYTAK